jgi:hypothetical protein
MAQAIQPKAIRKQTTSASTGLTRSSTKFDRKGTALWEYHTQSRRDLVELHSARAMAMNGGGCIVIWQMCLKQRRGTFQLFVGLQRLLCSTMKHDQHPPVAPAMGYRNTT